MKNYLLVLLFFIPFIPLRAQVTIIAAGVYTEAGPATDEFEPDGIFVDRFGNLYVADFNDYRVLKFHPGSAAGTYGTVVAGGNGQGTANDQFFYVPNDIFIDSLGYMYVGDQSRILKFPPGSDSNTYGILVAGTDTAGSAANQLKSTGNIYVNALGDIYVMDGGNNRVQKFPAGSSTAITVANGYANRNGQNQFEAPSGVYFDNQGYFYVADFEYNRVLKFPPGSDSTTLGSIAAGGNGTGNAANQLSAPAGIWGDKYGNIYVCDQYNSRVQEFPQGSDSTTNGTTVFDLRNTDYYADIADVFVDDSNYLYITDEGGSVVLKVNLTPVSINTKGSSYCLGTTDSIHFTTTGWFYSINVFTAQLSDSSGSFDNPVTIGTLDSSNGSVIPVGIPLNTPAGKNYRVRVVSSLPAVMDTAGAAFIIDPIPPAPVITVSGQACAGIDTLTADNVNSSQQIDWFNRDSLLAVVTSYVLVGTVAGMIDTFSGANQLNEPNSIFVDDSGNVYVADFNNSRIQKFPPGSTSATNGITAAGQDSIGANDDQLANPCGVFVDRSDYLYVVDEGNQRVMKFPPGSDSTTNGVAVAEGDYADSVQWLNIPYNAYVDDSGYLYVTDSWNNRVLKFPPGDSTTSGDGVIVAGGNGVGYNTNQLNQPTGVYKDHAGNLYVADFFNNRVLKFPSGSDRSTYGVVVAGNQAAGNSAYQLNGPEGIYVDDTGNLYVADQNNSRIQKFPPNSAFDTAGITIAGISQGFGPAQLNGPTDVFLDSMGNIYVADNGNNRVQKFPAGSRAGTNAITIAGGNGENLDANRFFFPNAVFVDSLGNIFVADEFNNRIQKFPPGSTSGTNGITVAGGNGTGSAANQFNNASDVVVDGAGNIYVADYNNFRIQKFPPNSTSATNGVTVAGGNGYGFNNNQVSPGGLCLDKAGNIYVADWDNSRIIAFPPGGDSTTEGSVVAGGLYGTNANELNTPYKVCLDSDGNIYVADFGNSRVQKFPVGSGYGTPGITVGGGNGQGSHANQLNQPAAVYVDAAGNLYVADYYNERLQKFPSGSTSATDGTTIGGGNGRGNADNQLHAPAGVCGDNSGNIYVADQVNDRIQKFGPAATASTIFIPDTAGSYTATYIAPTGCTSAVSNAITINPVLTLSLTVSAPAYLCSGAADTFYASEANGGSHATYQWYWNFDQVGTNSLVYSASGFHLYDLVWVVMTSDTVCAKYVLDTSNYITIFLAYPPEPVITQNGSDTLVTGQYSAYEWFRNDSVINQAVSQYYLASLDGQYTVYVIDSNGCSNTSTPYNLMINGINQISETDIRLYPNPTTGTFILQTTNLIHQPFIIYDMLGNKIWQDVITADKQVVELKGLAAGSYMVRVGNEGNGRMRNLTIQK